jgi:hypothetical protein
MPSASVAQDAPAAYAAMDWARAYDGYRVLAAQAPGDAALAARYLSSAFYAGHYDEAARLAAQQATQPGHGAQADLVRAADAARRGDRDAALRALGDATRAPATREQSLFIKQLAQDYADSLRINPAADAAQHLSYAIDRARSEVEEMVASATVNGTPADAAQYNAYIINADLIGLNLRQMVAPGDDGNRLALAQFYQDRGASAEALRQASTITHQTRAATILRAQALDGMGRHAQADGYLRAQAQATGDIYLHRTRAELLMQRGAYAQAIDAYDTVINDLRGRDDTLEHEDYQALSAMMIERGLAHKAAGHYQQAADDFQDAIFRNEGIGDERVDWDKQGTLPGFIRASYEYAETLMVMNKFPQHVDYHLDRVSRYVLGTDPQRPAMAAVYAWNLQRQGHVADALSIYQALEKYPGYTPPARIYVRMGEAYDALGMRAEGQRCFEAAREQLAHKPVHDALEKQAEQTINARLGGPGVSNVPQPVPLR